MRVLVVGGGGREHALVHSFAQSPLAGDVYCAPGNAGTRDEANNVNISADDLPGLLDFAQRNAIDLTVVGPEAPLVAGLADLFATQGLRVFGPSQTAAQLEGSKAFAKDIMTAGRVPTARYQRFDNVDEATAALRRRERWPVVIKANGLAAGKGVMICDDRGEALEAADACFVQRTFGSAGDALIIEEFLVGTEVSLLVLCDGKTAVPLAPAQD